MEDFRTEILGLVKAQMVKNVVIVPVGSKGGFVLKNPPPQTDREAYLNEGIECYKSFLRGLLDVTDNLVANELVPPKNVVRHDGDDPYLVVSATTTKRWVSLRGAHGSLSNVISLKWESTRRRQRSPWPA